jgi:hypothetical protein
MLVAVVVVLDLVVELKAMVKQVAVMVVTDNLLLALTQPLQIEVLAVAVAVMMQAVAMVVTVL